MDFNSVIHDKFSGDMDFSPNIDKYPAASSYNIKMFDLGIKKEAAACMDTMLKITNDVRLGTCVLWRNDRDIMTRQDGSQTWVAHIEWSEYIDNEKKHE